MNFRLFVLFFLSSGWIAVASAQETPSILPFEPAQMLSVLPAAPPEWKMLRSEADVTLGDWLETRARRVFQAPPAPAAAPSAKANSVSLGEIEIVVVDTAGFAPALAAFADFLPGKNANVEKKLIGSLPAIIITGADERQFVQVLVSSRYMIELILTHLPHQRLEDWLRGFRFESLPPRSKTLTSRPREFRLTHLDELQPRNNRSYVVSTTNSKRVEDFLKTLPAESPEPTREEPISGGRP